jgi:hypothetical protein
MVAARTVGSVHECHGLTHGQPSLPEITRRKLRGFSPR